MSMLENGISQTVREDTLPAGRFLQVSGLCYSYRQADEEQPSKLLSVTLEGWFRFGTGCMVYPGHYRLYGRERRVY